MHMQALGRRRDRLAVLAVMVAAVPAAASAAPSDSIHTTTFQDATTYQNRFLGSDNKWHWTIDAGADSYPDDRYERPVEGGFRDYDGQFATDSDYFGYLDITQARVGYDNQYLYAAIDLHDTNRYKPDQQIEDTGLIGEYRFHISHNADGSDGFLFTVQDPSQNGTGWATARNYVYWDGDGDLAYDGAAPDLENDLDRTSGYETVIVNDGSVQDPFPFPDGITSPFYSRISPGDGSVVEFAIDYEAFGFSVEDLLDLGYLMFESNRVGSSSSSPDKYRLSHVYAPIDVGSPYDEDNYEGSPYGKQGPKDFKMIDTLHGGEITAFIPTPAALPAGLVLAGLCGLSRRRRHRLP